ncbi:hypothetical protein PFTANZ_06299, partial [Plasmodium falciparum Tanzania (2000708)]
MGRGSAGTEDAKHVLDEFGQKVYKEVKNESETYKEALTGQLSLATLLGVELVSTTDTCTLVEDYYTKRLKHERYPCKKLSGKMGVNRFSDKIGGQCTDSKMRSGGIGACAPYRRLHLCHHNLESINTDKIDSGNAKHNLLLEVCMAAKYEGNSIDTPYIIHQQTNEGSQLCTVLARSFADIGDIVRGRDLFHGNPQEKEKREDLEKKLKEIFGKIHEGLTNGVKERYKKDGDNFYQLREDWWYANRATIWEALTCDPRHKAEYFRRTCGGDNENTATQASHKCRCSDKPNTDPPTYFDYVPQYLRWFEEWAEDFCRLRKRKLQNAKEQCREKHKGDKKLYCDLNRHDCEKTASGKHDFFVEDDCKYCHFSCSHFVKWIDNQKLEFLKQREKYKSEMQKYTNGGGGSGSRRQKRDEGGATTTNYDGYEKKFYEKFKGKCGTVNKFLQLLNNETTCKKNNEIEDGGNIDFKNVHSGSAKKGDSNNKTFYRTTYCEACPWCGAEKGEDGKGWKAKEETCGEGMGYEGYNDTKIPILTGDKKQLDILKKYSKFCNSVNGKNGANGREGGGGGDNSDNATTGYCGTNNSDKGPSLCEKWTCYYKKNGKDDGKDINFCVQGEWKEFKKGQKVKSYKVFFLDWVYHMLHDSLDWRKELDNCLKNENKQCIIKCNRECDCFAKWVEHKQQEWDAIKKHFKKQKDIVEQTRCNPFVTLELLFMNGDLLKNIEDTHADVKEDEIKNIREMLQETGVADGVDAGSDKCTEGAKGKHNTKIDKFLREELNDATKCLQKCKEQEQSLGRSLKPRVVDDDGAPKKRDTRTNPCYGDKQYPVLAGKVAETLQGEANKNMVQRSVKKDESESVLKGDISQAKFRKGVKGSDLNGKICKIDTSYSNDIRGSKKGGPCTGKDGSNERFKIGTPWKSRSQIQMSAEDIYMPPRRQHMCTSNLENLDVESVTKNGDASHSLLGDVQLAAKYEAENIKKLYVENNDRKDQEAICRAVRYSFADLGDIIRGRDMWENGEAKQLQNDLVTIFRHIHSSLNGKGKYASDENKTTPYKQLREAWWKANRSQVWDAMICETPSGKNPCSGTDVPLDDYIPQRLRWMTEWAEWFCKMQSQEYEKLEDECGICMNGKCVKVNGECAKCTQACEEYKKKIEPWKNQWETMSFKYLTSYRQAKNGSGGMAFLDADYQQVVDFLSKLHTQNSGNSIYESAAGYIHQELPHTQCQIQKEFCYYKNGVDGNTDGAKENKKYAFKHPPHEYEVACKCDTRDQQPTGDRGRSENHDPQSPHASPTGSNEDDLDDEDDDEDDEDDEDDGEDEPAEGEAEEEKKAEEKESEEANGDSTVDGKGKTAPKEGPPVNVCETVKKALEEDKLQDACKQKYGYPQRHWGWRCVTPTTSSSTSERGGASRNKRNLDSTKSSDKNGSICIPPRRRKLYIKKIQDWAESQSKTLTSVNGDANGSQEVVSVNGASESGESGNQGSRSDSSSSSSSDSSRGSTQASTSPSSNLRDDDLVKAFVESAAVETFFLWHKYKAENTKTQGGGAGLGLLGEEPPKEENPQTKLETGEIPEEFKRQMFYTLGDYRDICVGNTDIVVEALSSSEKEKMKEIQDKIKEHINSVSQQTGTPAPKPSDKLKSWWQNIAKDIWNGMVCALTYKDNSDTQAKKSDGTTNITQDQSLKTKLWDDTENKPKNGNDYNSVKLDEHSGTEAKPAEAPASSDTPTLDSFVKRPPYFRYLEEWGQNFCKERMKRLEKIKVDCRGVGGKYTTRYSSGDGEDCNDQLPEDPSTFHSIEYPGCAGHCRKYKKWIDIKKKEFDKQKSAYEQQKEKCKTESNGAANGVCGKLEKDAAKFLEKLKTGPCKKDNASGEDKLNFKEPDVTFKPADNCKPCSEFKIKCENGVCSGGSTDKKCDGKTPIDAKDIAKMINSPQEVTMLVSDNSGNGFDDGLKACQNAGIFKGFRKDVWECGNVCGYEVCKPKEGNRETVRGEKNDDKHIITIRALVTHWVHNFLEDYNKIRKKLKPCMNSSDGSTCQNKCNDKCNCASKWIDEKRTEWQKIRDRFKEQYKVDPDYNVKTILQELIPKIAPKKNNGEVTELSDLERSLGCNCPDSSQKKDGNEDAIDCMLNKLQQKATSCQNPGTSGEKQTTCDENSTPLDDEDLTLEETEENTVEAPKICPTQPKETEEEEDACKAATTEPAPATDSGSHNPEQTPILKPEEEAPTPDVAPPATPNHQPLPSDNTSDILKTTIPFGIAIALTSIVFLFLK